jgi:hypothetical protein
MDADSLRAAKLIDELLVLSKLYEQDYNVVDDALHFLAATRRVRPEFPLTVALAEYMRQRGLIN